MRALIKDFAASFVMGLVLPSVVLGMFVTLKESRAAAMALSPPVSVQRSLKRYQTRILDEKGVREEDLDDYLVGVVLAEMPVEFEPEALKAQAVAARTYTRRAFETGGKHGNGSVCLDSGCCQAYISAENYLLRGGTEEGLDKVRSAVEGTSGQVLCYQGELIEATYFSCSGGNTEDAKAVWGTDYPYLKSVSSPGEEQAEYYRDTVRFSPDVFCRMLELELSGEPESWIGEESYSAGGTVQTMVIGGETFTGVQLRSLLKLRSAAFTVAVTDGEIEITTKGHGHRVGMSQYGAEAMAVQGSTYEQILSHYYPGAELTQLTGS